MNRSLILLAAFVVSIGANARQIAPLGLNFNAPTVSNKSSVEDPKIGEIVYDYSDHAFWGYRDSSLGWTQLGGNGVTATQPNAVSNLSVSTSVASNALTVALKDQNGSDPSVGSPVTLGFRNSSASNGTFSQQSVTSALSLTVSSGSTLGCNNGSECQLFVYALDSGSGVVLGVSKALFDEGTLASSTAEGGAGAADSASTLYTASAQSSKPIRMIGRIRVTEATAGTWASNSTEISPVPFGFASSIGSSGYYKLPGGLIVQWTTATASTTGAAVSWPINFPNAVLSVHAQSTNQIAAINASSPSVSGVTLTVSSGSPSCHVFALGY